MKVSIIIPVFNREKVLSETLDSILEQSYHNWECILVDDGSTDNSYEIAAKYAKRDTRFIVDKRPEGTLKGANACRNYGIDLSSGQLLMWLDSDDLLLNQYLEKKVKRFEETGCDIVISKSQHFNHPDPYDIFYNDQFNYKFQDKEITALNFATHNTTWLTSDLMVKREVIHGKYWNEYLPSGQEYNYFLQILKPGLNFEFIDEYLISKRWHPESITARRDEDTFADYVITLRIETLLNLDRDSDSDIKEWLLLKILKATARNRKIRSLREEKLIFRFLVSHNYLSLGLKYYLARITKLVFNRNEFIVRKIAK
jgi:glycosyltransferase involved in cell wall biosynthesis